MSSSKVDLLGSSSEDSYDLLTVVRTDHNFPLVDREEDNGDEDEDEDEEVEELDAFAGVCLVSVLKPSAVTHAISCHFTSSTDINLILGRGTRLEILVFKDAKLQVVKDIPYCGRIMALQHLRSSSMASDTLCLMTELSPRTYELRILQWNSYEDRMTLSDKIAIPYSFGEFYRKKICCIDREKKLIGLLFCLKFKVWRLSDEGKLEEIVSFRWELFVYLDQETNQFGILLHHDNDHWSKLVFSDLGEIVNVEQLVDYHFSRLVPLSSHDGFIGISRRSVRLKIQDDFDSADFDHDIMASTFTIDGSLLIADAAGDVYTVEISENEEQIFLNSSVVAQGTSIASALVALTNEFIFIGSSSGDSQLLKLHGPVIDTLYSISPVVDMCMFQQAAGQKIVMACGNYGDGSLRSLSHSCTFKIFGYIEMKNSISGFWTHMEGDDLHLVYSFLGGFVGCQISLQALWSNDNSQDQPKDVTATMLGGFDMTEMLLYVALGHHHVQVTSSAVILSSSETGILSRWSCPHTITVATSFEDKILVAHGEYCLTLLQINGRDFKVIGSRKMPAAVSCLNIGQDGSMVAIGMWSKVILAAFPSLSEIDSLDLNDDQMIRSVLLFQFHEMLYLMYGVAQGSLAFYQKQNTLTRLGEIRCSSTPITELKIICVDGVDHILAVSARPVVVCIKNGEFHWMSLNLQDATFLSVVEPDRCFWIVPNGQDCQTVYGTIESVISVECQRRTQAHGRSICFQKSSDTFMVATCENGQDRQEHIIRHSLRLYNLTYDFLANFSLSDLEYGWSIASGCFQDDREEFYCVGTVFVDPDNHATVSSHSGRILVFRVEQANLECLVAEVVTGPVYALQFCNNRLLATVQTCVCLYDLNGYRGWGLHMVDSRSGNIANPHGLIHLSTFGNQIVAGASIGSPYLMEYKDDLDVLIDEPIHGFGGSSATICMDKDFFISANFEKLTLSCHAPHKENKWKPLGEIFIGEFVTNVQPLCFAVKSQASKANPWIFSTAMGSICCVIPVRRRELNLLDRLCHSVSRLLADEFLQMRAWEYSQSSRFIDGDYICCLLCLDDNALQKIAQEIGVELRTILDLVRYVASFRFI